MFPEDVSVVIPTYERGEVLLATLRHLLGEHRAAEILVVDQTPQHDVEVGRALRALDGDGAIRWVRLAAPSIPGAMNEGLRQARRPLVLFLDDDVLPGQGLVAAHAACYADSPLWAVAGQVLQPGQLPEARLAGSHGRHDGLTADLDFAFNGTAEAWIANCMAGNLSVRRDRALEIGGFDENFVGVAYRFETDFSRRVLKHGGRIRFEPKASLRHLKAPRGGTRMFGDHRASPSPSHGVGDYYFALRHGSAPEALAHILRRPIREISTWFHLRHPWWIPVKLLGELRAVLWALRLARAGPRYGARG